MQIEEAFAGLPIYQICEDADAPGVVRLQEWVRGSGLLADRIRVLPAKDWKEALAAVFSGLGASEDYDSVAWMEGYYPLLDVALTHEIGSLHRRYLAHVTYAENLPEGLVPDLIARDFIRKLPEGASFAKPPRRLAFENVEIFDVELFYKSPDLPLHRLDLSCSDARSVRLVETLLELSPELRARPPKTPFGAAELAAILDSHSEALLRPFPACIEVELSGRAAVSPIYRLPLSGRELAPSLYTKLLQEIERDGMKADATIIFGGSGDALLHPKIVACIEDTLANPNVKCLILETYLSELREEVGEFLRKASASDRLHLIIRLGSTEEAVWRELHGSDSFGDVMKNIEKLEGILSVEGGAGFCCHAEMLRMNENDAAIDAFMERFASSPIRPLLGKYNSFLGELPDRRAVDLSPLVRSYCWHLARDLYLNVDGQVAFCKQDPTVSKGPSWDFSNMSLQEIWRDQLPFWKASFAGDYDRLPLPCRKCDEWYTFNA